MLTILVSGNALSAGEAAPPWRGGRRWPKGAGRSDGFRRAFDRTGSSPWRNRLPPLLHFFVECLSRLGKASVCMPSIWEVRRASFKRPCQRPGTTRQIGRAHVSPVPNAHLVCRLLLDKTKKHRTK